MSKILKIDEMLEIASEVLPAAQYEQLVDDVEKAATRLAWALADHYDITTSYADFQGEAFAGTCAPFWMKTEGQPCPEPIDQADEGGDWHMPPDCAEITREKPQTHDHTQHSTNTGGNPEEPNQAGH